MTITIRVSTVSRVQEFLEKNILFILVLTLGVISVLSFVYFLSTGLNVAYNDARSHLDIGRRVVESLKPGLAQLGSVWLPLPHLLMLPTIWNDWFWHTGMSGALQSMISFVLIGVLIYLFLQRLGVNMVGRLIGVVIFVLNLNILYMQSTAMTELLLLASMTAGIYELLKWEQTNKLVYLIRSSLWIMLSTLNRYDGWFLFLCAAGIIAIISYLRQGRKAAEGRIILFCSLAGVGILAWFVWNYLIFHDPLYFAFGPYSAHTQQDQLASQGYLSTRRNVLLSFESYLFALVYNSNLLIFVISLLGSGLIFLDKKLRFTTKLVLSTLFVPFVFNVLALYLGHSVLFIQGISGNTWFNVRYGIMMVPSLAILSGYLVGRVKNLRVILIGLILLVTAFMFINQDAVTIDDARYGESQKNVSGVSNWLHEHVSQENGYILMSVAKNDAVAFSSDLPMSRYITEGTGKYWDGATTHPSHWVRWVVMRTNDDTDEAYVRIHNLPEFKQKYSLVVHFPYADIYELKPQYTYTQPSLAQSKL